LRRFEEDLLDEIQFVLSQQRIALHGMILHGFKPI